MIVPWVRGVEVMLLFVLVTARFLNLPLRQLKPCPSEFSTFRDAQVSFVNLGRPVVWLLMRFGFPAAV